MKEVKKFAPIGAAVLGFVAVLMIFVASIVSKYNSSTYYTGLSVVFGNENLFWFSFMNLFPYLLVIGGIVLCVLNFLGKGKPVFVWIAVGFFVAAAVCFFLTIPFSMPQVPNSWTAADIDAAKEASFLLGAGPIVSGICSILAACVTATPFLLDKLVK